MRNYSGGFTYFGILITIALLGTSLSAVGVSWSVERQRAAEQQLIHTGQTIRRAIASYYNATPQGTHQYPRRLADLLEDRRGTKMVRHLREIYGDPITRRIDWNLETLPDGSILGVSSRSTKKPLKQANFGASEAAFEGAGCYCDWKFVYLPQLTGSATVTL